MCEHICLAGLKKTRSISHMSTTDQCVWKSCANNKQTVQTVVFLLKCRIFFFTGYLSCFCSTASNSNRSSPACSPVLHKRLRSPTPQSPEGENMVEKSSDHSSDKSPSTPEQAVQRTYSQSLHTTRPAGKNSKVNMCDCTHCTSALSPFSYTACLAHLLLL